MFLSSLNSFLSLKGSSYSRPFLSLYSLEFSFASNKFQIFVQPSFWMLSDLFLFYSIFQNQVKDHLFKIAFFSIFR